EVLIDNMSLSGAITHVGTPPDERVIDKHTVEFHDFQNLTTTKGEAIVSPEFSCAGHKWTLRLYPGGREDLEDDGMVSFYLSYEMSSDIVASFDIIIRNSKGDIFWADRSDEFYQFARDDPCSGGHVIIERDKLLNTTEEILPCGALVIEVCIQLHPDYVCHSVEPQCTLVQDVTNLFNDEGTADITFRVMGKDIFAHKLILGARVPDLAVMCDAWDKSNPLPIDDVEPELFEMMIKHEYGEPIPAAIWKEKAEPILIAAGKYGFRQLKLQAEAWHVKNLKLTVNNAVDCLLQSDGHDLPLLKKASMEFIVSNADEVFASESYSRLRGSTTITGEVMSAMAKRIKQLSENKKRKHGE
ncbi:hypothetical protein ACHAW6_000137, partial [Cyclotella cf. meneghiniana]